MDGDGLGLKVKITPVIDRSQLNSEAKKVEDQLNKNVKLSGTGGLGKSFEKLMPKSMKSALGSFQAPKFSGGGGGGLGKAAVAGGVAGLAMAGIQGILEILKKMFSLMLEASPSLKAILKMLNQGFMMILRPLGDALAMMLRPIAMFFRVIGRQVMKQMRAKRAELKAEGLSGGALGMALMEEMPTMYLQVLIDALANVNWGDIWNKYLDIVWTNITERFPAFLATLWEGFLGMRDGLINTLAGFGGWLWGVLSDVSKWGLDKLSGFGTWIWNTLTGKIGAMDNLKTVANSIYDVFVTIYNKLADLAGLVGIRVDKLLSSSQQAAFDTSTHDREKSDFYKYHPELAPKADTGADVLQTGYAIIHKGERVLNPSETAAYNAGGGAMNVSVSIPGSAISDAIDRRIDAYYKTKVVARR